MDLRQLELFAELARELHFARVAKKCHMTSSAVTRSLQRLEEELGCILLLRNNRRVELTPAGEIFADYARDAIDQWLKVRSSLQPQSAELSGYLKIYSSVTASYSVLAPLLEIFRKAYPQVEIQLHTGDQAEAIARVQAGHEEIGIAALPDILPTSLVFKTLTFSPLRFIMPSGHGAISEQVASLRNRKRGVLNPADLPLIVSEQGLARKRLDVWLKNNGKVANIYAQVSGHEAIVSMVALGCGIGLVPELVIQHSPLRDKIRIIDDAPVLQAFQIGLCASKNRLDYPAVKAFWEVAHPSIFTGESNGEH